MGRVAASHAARCADCRAEVERLRRLRTLVQSAEARVVDPDWVGFWPAVRQRIAAEHPAPVRDAWWLPFWRPVWGHPRVALGGLVGLEPRGGPGALAEPRDHHRRAARRRCRCRTCRPRIRIAA